MKTIETIKEWFKNLISRIGLITIKRKCPILKEVFDHPENVKLEAYVENDEIIIKVKKR
ncbi:MAG: hypothetical protein J6Q84_07240 [Kiritimatiellae bacterium]|nr:hypothetical protein [Kiritimatiellia bacterium]